MFIKLEYQPQIIMADINLEYINIKVATLDQSVLNRLKNFNFLIIINSNYSCFVNYQLENYYYYY